MTRKTALSFIVVSAILAFSPFAVANVVTFEEYAPLRDVDLVDVTSTGGLSFSSNIGVLHGVFASNVSALYGHINLASSGTIGALIPDQLSITTDTGVPFNLESIYLGMTHPYDSPLNIFQGSRNGQVIYSMNVVPGQSPTLFQFNWQAIDAMKVTSHYNTGYFVADDIAYSISAVPESSATAVPESSSVFMFMIGLLSSGIFLRRRQNFKRKGHHYGYSANNRTVFVTSSKTQK